MAENLHGMPIGYVDAGSYGILPVYNLISKTEPEAVYPEDAYAAVCLLPSGNWLVLQCGLSDIERMH